MSFARFRLVLLLVAGVGLVAAPMSAQNTKNKGWLGILAATVNPTVAKTFDVPVTAGALIEFVLSGSPAEKGGIHEGDVVVRANDQAIANQYQLTTFVASKRPGETVALELFRKSEKHRFKVVLASCPSDADLAEKYRQGTSNSRRAKGMSLWFSYFYMNFSGVGRKEVRRRLFQGVGRVSGSGPGLSLLFFGRDYLRTMAGVHRYIVIPLQRVMD